MRLSTPETDEQELSLMGVDGDTYVAATFARSLERRLIDAECELEYYQNMVAEQEIEIQDLKDNEGNAPC